MNICTILLTCLQACLHAWWESPQVSHYRPSLAGAHLGFHVGFSITTAESPLFGDSPQFQLLLLTLVL